MTMIYVEPSQESKEVLPLVRSAIENEITRLDLALELAQKRPAQFEQKYGVSSDHFITTMVAEDLEGGDEEYVCWAGEYKLIQQLEEKLHKLQ
jgi:hypothetical protein